MDSRKLQGKLDNISNEWKWNIEYQNVWDVANPVLTGKFMILNTLERIMTLNQSYTFPFWEIRKKIGN